MSSSELEPSAIIEGLLFVASGTVPIGRIAKTLALKPKQVEKLLHELQEQLLTRGLNLQWTTDGVQLTTAPEIAKYIEQFLGLDTTTRLSPAALEVMSIVAYMQPVTRPQIDRIRGVNSDGSLRKLLTFSLIEEVGRQDTPGRPILYATTPEFLQQFG
ncbi:MAG TPA: SMC-Scp complex subunit ScpB, partial [Anaerolineae bacterium]|nr:SMC-Scp complex subunit ScpB [Anaerolineae bacterium]